MLFTYLNSDLYFPVLVTSSSARGGGAVLFILSEAERDFTAVRGSSLAAFNSLFHSHGLVGSFMGSCAVRMSIMLKPQSALLCFFLFFLNQFTHRHFLSLTHTHMHSHATADSDSVALLSELQYSLLHLKN